MKNPLSHDSRFGTGKSWRAYQKKLQTSRNSALQRQRLGKKLKVALLVSVAIFLIYVGVTGTVGNRIDSPPRPQSAKKADPPKHSTNIEPVRPLAKNDLQEFWDGHTFLNRWENQFEIRRKNEQYVVQTTLDSDLQKYLTNRLDKRHSRYIAIVAMDPQDGRILAMVGFDKTDPNGNPCINRLFPAASIFKIVTAAAAVEQCRLHAQSTLFYNGRKHTLYKSQLTDRKNKYTNRITFRDSFAQSVNPVFGKLGALRLGKDSLQSYAEAFGFNRTINFEMQMVPSRITLTDKPYQWAEIASGFNRETRISALHGALIAATIVNNGRLIEPTIIRNITDQTGHVLYESKPVIIDHAIAPQTSVVLQELMQATVQSGTARRVFRKARKDKILSQVDIAGKTGSINNRTDDARFDWFVGYAEQHGGNHKLVLSVIVAHEDYIGTRATSYAKLVIREYFKNTLVDGSKTAARPPRPS